ncbi:isoprenylcysteine carboxylmethyltransferase family protein [Candidatus Thorarchaeota archaeon]|nr:MAG: isoprenylcysteine carboxylmethyltransferase family protein [Candidatus Thorarchaeota archaeon]
MRFRDHISAFMLPLAALILIPMILLLVARDARISWEISSTCNSILLLTGAFLLLIGVWLMVVTIKMFYQLGKGTLAPWAPTQNLVMTGIYLRTRNPMISGVISVIIGEGLIFSSWAILLWGLIFLIGNHFYFIFSEEPRLHKRFGEEYLLYKENVPRWIPRLSPWNPNHKSVE